MEIKEKLKVIDIKNRTCHYFDDIVRFWDRNIKFSDISQDGNLYKEKYENILIYQVSYKMGARLLRIIKIHDNVRYLALFDYSYCDKFCDKNFVTRQFCKN